MARYQPLASGSHSKAKPGGRPKVTSYTGKDGITHVIMRNGDHYAGRNGNYTKVR